MAEYGLFPHVCRESITFSAVPGSMITLAAFMLATCCWQRLFYTSYFLVTFDLALGFTPHHLHGGSSQGVHLLLAKLTQFTAETRPQAHKACRFLGSKGTFLISI